MRPIEAEGYLTAKLAGAGLDLEHLDLWETWKLFKEFARTPVEADGEGVCVHLVVDHGPEGKCLYVEFLRQFTMIEEEESVPFRGTWVEFVYDARETDLVEETELWSYDFPSFAAFAARVESLPVFQQAVARRPLESSVRGGEL